MSARVNVREHVLLYPSVDQYGDSLLLSGKITVPPAPKGIILLPHFTISSNSETPSVSSKGEEQHFRNDYILILPDYIGYGVTRERVHPYLHGELTARNCVDMLLASGRVLDSMGVNIPKDTISIVGFSQGGASALWTLKLLELEYADQFYVRECYAGSGPYDVAATYDQAVAANKVGMPLVISMLVMGTSEAYGLKLNRQQFFTPAQEKAYKKYIATKDRSILSLLILLPSHKVDHWLTAYGADKSNPETRRLYEGLMRSSLVHFPYDDHELGQQLICPEWRPRAKVYVLHSTTDKIVPFVNAEHLRRCWQDLDNVTYDFGDYGSHLPSSRRFFKRVKEMLGISK